MNKSASRHRAINLLLPTFCLVAVVSNLATAQETNAKTRKTESLRRSVTKEGARSLFIGHSFFAPVARAFGKLGTENEFSSHRVDIVFSPGASGTPGALWKNQRQKKKIEDKLATGKIDLLGMTVGNPKNGYQDYQRWIDLALKYNPETKFFIGLCWPPGGPKLETKNFDKLIEASSARQFALVKKLRKAYPNNRIYFINYGKTASLMKEMYEADKLRDIKQLVGRSKQSLFLDGFMGHGGPMLVELSAQSLLSVLYNFDIDDLEQLSFHEADVAKITKKVLKFNEQFDN